MAVAATATAAAGRLATGSEQRHVPCRQPHCRHHVHFLASLPQAAVAVPKMSATSAASTAVMSAAAARLHAQRRGAPPVPLSYAQHACPGRDPTQSLRSDASRECSRTHSGRTCAARTAGCNGALARPCARTRTLRELQRRAARTLPRGRCSARCGGQPCTQRHPERHPGAVGKSVRARRCGRSFRRAPSTERLLTCRSSASRSSTRARARQGRARARRNMAITCVGRQPAAALAPSPQSTWPARSRMRATPGAEHEPGPRAARTCWSARKAGPSTPRDRRSGRCQERRRRALDQRARAARRVPVPRWHPSVTRGARAAQPPPMQRRRGMPASAPTDSKIVPDPPPKLDLTYLYERCTRRRALCSGAAAGCARAPAQVKARSSCRSSTRGSRIDCAEEDPPPSVLNKNNGSE